MSTPIRLGVIGLSINGGWATNLLAPLLDPSSPVAPKYKLTALATRTAASATATAEKYAAQLGHPVTAYSGASAARDIAADPEVDVVVVTVRVGHHRASVLPAIEAGKDVFVEWPLGRGLEEGREIAEKARARGVRSMVGTQGVHAPVVTKIREVVQAGKIGKVVSTSITAIFTKESPIYGASTIQERHSYIAEANSGGSHTELVGGHLIAGLIHALGDISSLSATHTTLYPTLELLTEDHKPTGKTMERGSPDQVAFSGVLASGATVSLQLLTGISASAAGHTPEFYWIVRGETGTIEVTGGSPYYSLAPPTQVLVNGEPWALPDGYNYLTGPIQSAWEEFAKGTEGAYASFEDGLKVHRVADGIIRSARDGVRVEFD